MTPAESSKGTVVVVDDSEIVLESTRLVLEEAGFHVLTLSNPLLLAQPIASARPDVVLLDLEMPALRGDKVVKVLDSFGLLHGTTIVIHSSRDTEDLKRIVEEIHVAGYLRKTDDAEELVREVTAWVSRARATR